MVELKIYRLDMQKDIGSFYYKVFQHLKWEYEPFGRHFDTIDISHAYMENGRFWCLYDNEQLVGTIALRTIDKQSKTAELKRFYILPEYQGKGYGNLLFRALIEFAKEKKFNAVRTDTRNTCNVSQHLMRKYGFREIPRYNDNAYADLFFELIL